MDTEQKKFILEEHEKNREDLLNLITNCKDKEFIQSCKLIKNFLLNNCKLENLLGHLRLCGAIPEKYKHDSTEEKLYSKYTDILINIAFQKMGFDSTVLKDRADSADVECTHKKYDFVSDAKAFRLSRTAKNQKDFKIEAMNSWKKGKKYALLVCPIYQLPSRNSQIYRQSSSRNVCITTYTHLATIIRYAQTKNGNAVDILEKIFECVPKMNISKDASEYWQTINTTMLDFDKVIQDIWMKEKGASIEAIEFAKKEAISFLNDEKVRIEKLTKEDAIKEILQLSKIYEKVDTINKAGTGILEIV